jgi:hypothetical protein
MIRNSCEAEMYFILTLKPLTGRSLRQWMNLIRKKNWLDRRSLIRWLKAHYALGHLNASLMAGIYFNNGKPVYTNNKTQKE